MAVIAPFAASRERPRAGTLGVASCFAALALLIAACDDDQVGSVTTGFHAIGRNEAVLGIGDTARLLASARTRGSPSREKYDSRTVPAAFGWFSADEGIARVEHSGLVTAVDSGVVALYATAEGVISSPATLLYVSRPAVAIRVTPDRLQMQVGDTLTVTVDGIDAQGFPVGGIHTILSWGASTALRQTTTNPPELTPFTLKLEAMAPATLNITSLIEYANNLGPRPDTVSVAIVPPPS